MKKGPLVSVVVPMYNVAATVAEAIDSVLAQSYTHWELIAVDDGSEDNSRAIVEAYDDPRIRVVVRNNGGLSAARNTGIEHADSNAELVAFLDADDMWRPEKLACHIEHFSNLPRLGVSYSGSQFMDASGCLLTNRQTPKLRDVSARDIFLNNPIGNGSAPVIRMQTLQEVERDQGEYFCESLRQSEDVELWLRIALMTTWTFAGVADHLTLYRVNQSGLSANVNAQFAAWLRAVDNNRVIAPAFIDRWFDTAAAFQCRYLARRAVQSGDFRGAFTLLSRAFQYGGWSLTKDTRKTLGTLLGAFAVCILPGSVIGRLRSLAGQLAL